MFFTPAPVTLVASMMLSALPMYRANRGRHALASLRERLPLKRGIGMIVAKGCMDAMRPGQWIPGPRRIRVRFGEPVRFGTVGNDREGWDTIAGELERRVRALKPS